MLCLHGKSREPYYSACMLGAGLDLEQHLEHAAAAKAGLVESTFRAYLGSMSSWKPIKTCMHAGMGEQYLLKEPESADLPAAAMQPEATMWSSSCCRRRLCPNCTAHPT